MYTSPVRLLQVQLICCLCAATAACRGGDDEDGSPDIDAGQTGGIVQAIGKPATIDVLCWNVRQFPSAATTVETLAAVLPALDVDVVAFMEIADDTAFANLKDKLPGWQTYLGKGDGYTKLALAWRSDRVMVTGATTIFDSDYDFPRPPIVATVSHGAGSMTLVAVHLKAGRATEDAARRENANTKLAGWVAGRGNGPTLLCGDFNEDQDNGYAAKVYASWLAAPQTYHMLTAPLDHGGTATYLPGRIMFDQMISTVSLDAQLGSERPFVPAIDAEIGDYQGILSDHLPVALRLDLH